MRCKNCKYFERVVVSKHDIISSNSLWEWKGGDIGYPESCECKVCGFEIPDEKGVFVARKMDDHIIKEHGDLLEELRNKRIGKCDNDVFWYKNPEYVTESEKGKVFYMDGEEYGADYWVDEDFGCIHFEEKK